MLYRFAGAELDCVRRELRVGTTQVPLQPQAFAVLQYLLEHRERVVSKAELLATLWPGVHVGDASLQRAISLARSALKDAGPLIRTHSKHGYRFSAEVSIAAAPPPVTAGSAGFVPRFARSDDVFIAYHTFGRGELDIVLVPGWVFPMQFDGPQRAIRCAHEFSQFDAGGVGVHTGEVSRERGELVGAAIDIARAIAARAAPAQVLVSSVVRDLVCSPNLVFEEHGVVPLSDGRAVAVLASKHQLTGADVG